MAVNSLGYFNYQNKIGVYPDGSPLYLDPKRAKKSIYTDFNPETKQAGRIPSGKDFPFGSINPRKDKVYFDPQTGEFTTWKPGIHNPEQQKNATKSALNLLALVAAGITAFVFRGKIKTVGKKVLNLAKPLIDKAKKFVPKGIKNVVKKVINNVQPAIKKVVGLVSSLVVNPLKNIFKTVSKTA